MILVFEYLYNSLSDVFHQAHGLLPVHVSRRYAHQTLMGLRHMHAHNVAHRDLSLGNILVDMPSNSVKIADLGLAVCASHFVLDRKISTLWYRAPEVFGGWKRWLLSGSVRHVVVRRHHVCSPFRHASLPGLRGVGSVGRLCGPSFQIRFGRGGPEGNELFRL